MADYIYSPTIKKKPPKRTATPPKVETEPMREEVTADGESVVTKRIIPLWGLKWNKEALQSKRLEMGSREFDRGYRQRAMSEDDLLFKPEWIDRALDRTIAIPDSIKRGDFWAKFPRDAGVDLAISEEQSAAFFAIIGVCTTRDWHRWLMSVCLKKGLSFNQQAGTLLEYQDRYQFDIVNVESNAYQESLVRHFKEEGVIGRVPVRGFRTGRLQKVDVELGVPSMAVEFEQDRIHIPYGNQRTRRIVEPLVEQLKAYPTPGAHDDAVMALFFAREARRLGNFVKADISILRV